MRARRSDGRSVQGEVPTQSHPGVAGAGAVSVPVSLAQEAVEKLTMAWCGAHLDSCKEEGRCCCPREEFEKDAREFWRSAQLAALESVAKEGCRQCAGNPPTAGPAEYDGEYWIHVYPGGSWGSCDRPEAWDAISRLRGTGGQS